MPTLFCHPDAWDGVQKAIGVHDSVRSCFPDFPILLSTCLFGMEVSFSSFMEKDKPSGRYVLPCGRVVDRADVLVSERFVEYGPEDIEWLLFSGVIKEERVLNYIIMQDMTFRPFMDYGVSLKSPFPRHSLISSFNS